MASSSPTGTKTTTYYEVLEIQQDAELIDVKKAYRRLALKHHPDRNNGSAESTERFKLISAAYEVLSDPRQRSEYDESLKSPPRFASGNSSGTSVGNYHHHYRARNHADPYSMFDNLFRNDPFFHEAFRGMDDEFAQRFDAQQSSDGPATTTRTSAKKKKRQGWGEWLINCLGIDFQMTTMSTNADGTINASSYSSRPGTAATNKTTRSYVDQSGRQVTIRSMERQGNKIEQKYVDNILVEQRVNGVVEPAQIIQRQQG